MTSTPTLPTVDFDHHSPEHAATWQERYAQLRTQCPVAHSPNHDGFWVITRYEDIANVSRDDDTFASGHDITGDGNGYGGISIPEPPFRTAPIELDGADFTATRKLLSPAFSPKSSLAWEPYTRASVTAHLDAVIESGNIDLVYDFGAPVPAKLTMRFLGLPEEDWSRYALPFHELMSEPGSDRHGAAIHAMGEFMGGLYGEIVARREQPADGYISFLLQCELDGEPLTDERMLEIVFLVIAGGVDTTTSLFSLGAEWLSQHPTERQALVDYPEQVPRAIEEFLRYFSPVQANARTVTRDTEIQGCPLSAGDRLLLPWAAANHDPEAFDEPSQMQLDRFPNRHTAFGLGAHRCLGSSLGRMQLRVMFEELLRRIPDFQVLADRTERYPSVGITNGLMTLPATFAPGTRIGSDAAALEPESLPLND